MQLNSNWELSVREPQGGLQPQAQSCLYIQTPDAITKMQYTETTRWTASSESLSLHIETGRE